MSEALDRILEILNELSEYERQEILQSLTVFYLRKEVENNETD